MKKSKFANRRKMGKPKAISVSAQEMIKKGNFPDSTLPAVITPNMPGVDLVAWIKENLAEVEAMVHDVGAVLFRDFTVPTSEAFEEVVDALQIRLINYTESSTPRTKVTKRVYTSTEFPAEETIALHNELSVAATFPMRVSFYCLIQPGGGGQTPIADVRKVLNHIDPEVLAEFEEKGWLLIRNYGDGFGLRWQDAFHTEDPAEVEAYCRENHIEWEWKPGDRFKTYQKRPATAIHPTTGEKVWFNHMAFWHVANLRPQVGQMLLGEFGEEGLPYHTYFGDGSKIPNEVANAIRDAYLAEKTMFSWQPGDVIVIDNMLVAHGREPFTGERRILAALGRPYTRPDLEVMQAEAVA